MQVLYRINVYYLDALDDYSVLDGSSELTCKSGVLWKLVSEVLFRFHGSCVGHVRSVTKHFQIPRRILFNHPEVKRVNIYFFFISDEF